MKKILALALAMIFVFALAIPAFAVEVTNAPINSDNVPTFDDQSGTATVTYTMTGSYVAIIPATIPVAVPDTNNVDVTSVKLGYGQQLTVAVTYDGILDLKIGTDVKDTLAYTLKNGSTNIPTTGAQNVLTVGAGNNGFIGVTGGTKISASITDEAKYAGNYTDTVTFTIAVVAVPAQQS